MKVIEINEDEWWIGKSLEECVQDYKSETGSDDYEDAEELSLKQLEVATLSEMDDNETITGTITFKDELEKQIKKGGDFPRMFASTLF